MKAVTADQPDPAQLRDRLRAQLAGRQETPDFRRRQRIARAILDADPERRPWHYTNSSPRPPRRREGQR